MAAILRDTMSMPKKPMQKKTIFALSSGAGPSAIAIVRISGDKACDALKSLTRKALPSPRLAAVRALFDPRDSSLLDQALVLWLPGPATVTGEDIVELHLHGGRAVVAAVMKVLSGLNGLVPAVGGEFTRRAFVNGRMDLCQVEGFSDLLAAETESQRRNAMALSEGVLSQKVYGWRQSVLKCAAHVEAALDFSDEDDVPGTFSYDILRQILGECEGWLAGAHAEKLKEGIKVVLAGPPNAGKSTLLNTLVQRDATIVSPIAGTTRDIVEVAVSIDGTAFVFVDTAGLHEATQDSVEIEGMKRARHALESADILIWLGAPQSCPPHPNVIMVRSKADESTLPVLDEQLSLSAKTGQGLDALRDCLKTRSLDLLPAPSQMALNARQRTIIQHFSKEIESALCADDLLIMAEHLRLACNHLNQLVGHTGVEDMLDTLFSGFCIGK